jgi:anaphase-promoting complex subunit 1
MAIGMALGFVTLCGGRASLSRSNTAIACLVASLYPRFPAAASDNTYHPQPLRHLYALAVDFRGVEVRDVDTGEVVHAPLEVTLVPQPGGLADPVSQLRLLAPCVLPEVRLWRALRFAVSRRSALAPC